MIDNKLTELSGMDMHGKWHSTLRKPDKPNFYHMPPKEKQSIISVVETPIYEKVSVPEGTKFIEISDYIEAESGFGNGSATDMIEITFYGDENRDNVNYKEELEKFQQRKADYENKVKEWEETCKQIDKFNTELEKDILNQLKEKYE